MALPETPAAYSDCYEHLERAQESPNGIRILVPNEAEARHLRFRMYQARKLERRASRKLYKVDDPRWDKSLNDKFCITISPTAEDDGKFWVYIQPWKQEVEEVEEL